MTAQELEAIIETASPLLSSEARDEIGQLVYERVRDAAAIRRVQVTQLEEARAMRELGGTQ